MFNPYSVRPIGEPRYEDHLLDVFSRNFYEQAVPYEDDLKKEAGYGERLYKSEQPPSTDEIFVIAVIGQAVLDYVDNWEQREIAKLCGDLGREVLFNSRCLEIENEFFHQYDLTEDLFDRLLYELHAARSVDELKDQLKRKHTKFMNSIGKEN